MISSRHSLTSSLLHKTNRIFVVNLNACIQGSAKKRDQSRQPSYLNLSKEMSEPNQFNRSSMLLPSPLKCKNLFTYTHHNTHAMITQCKRIMLPYPKPISLRCWPMIRMMSMSLPESCLCLILLSRNSSATCWLTFSTSTPSPPSHTPFL